MEIQISNGTQILPPDPLLAPACRGEEGAGGGDPELQTTNCIHASSAPYQMARTRKMEGGGSETDPPMDDQISNETQIPPANPLLVFLDDSCRQNEEGAGGGDPENHHLRLYEPNWVDSIRLD